MKGKYFSVILLFVLFFGVISYGVSVKMKSSRQDKEEAAREARISREEYTRWMKPVVSCETIFNDKCDILEGETVYPRHVKAVIKKYNPKYNVNISYAENKNDFLAKLSKIKISKKPQAIFQYNEAHKYGFIFVKYNNQDYCVCVDTIPHLSEYTKDLFLENNNLYIKFNKKKYRVIMFGENLQKASKGCGYFTLAILKQLLKNDGKYLFEVIQTEEKFGIKDKTKRDEQKKSVIRGVDFENIKSTSFAPDIYKYAQSLSLQEIFDDRKLKNGKVNFSTYRKFYSKLIYKGEKEVRVSTKIFKIAQTYKDLTDCKWDKCNVTSHLNELVSHPLIQNSPEFSHEEHEQLRNYFKIYKEHFSRPICDRPKKNT